MNTKKKKILFILGCCAIALVLAVVVFAITFDINSYRARIETAASSATALEIRINGKMELSFFPLALSAKDIRVANKGAEIISVESLKLRTELMPLLKNQLKVTGCELVKPVVTIVKDADGTYNFESSEKKSTEGRPGETFSFNELKLSKGILVYLDGKTGEKTELKEFNLAINDLSLGNTPGDIVENISFKGTLDCKEILQRDYRIENLRATVKSTKGIFNFQPLTIGDLVYIDDKTGDKTELKEINLAINDLSLGNTPGDIIENITFKGTLGCKKILQRNYRIENLQATAKSIKGIFNLQPLTIGDFVYIDSKTGEQSELKEINLAINNLSLGNTRGDIIKNIAFTGTLGCKEIRKKALNIGGIMSPVSMAKGVIFLNPLSMNIFGSKCEGDVTIDESGVDAVYKINLKVSKLDFVKLEESFGTKKIIDGKGDLIASLTIKEKQNRNLISSMDGIFSIRGDSLVIYAMDLDKVLSAYETSQQFNLVDLGAFFVAGPLSTFALKGYRYGDVYNQTRGGQSTITQFISHWKIKDGVAYAKDCALATRHNRIALKGRLNLVSERYDNVIVALLDDKGCAKVKQSISGPFGNPQVGAVSVGESLAAPILNLYKKAKSLIQGGKCEVFYNGSVRQPPQ
jgi:AsmA protein